VGHAYFCDVRTINHYCGLWLKYNIVAWPYYCWWIPHQKNGPLTLSSEKNTFFSSYVQPIIIHANRIKTMAPYTPLTLLSEKKTLHCQVCSTIDNRVLKRDRKRNNVTSPNTYISIGSLCIMSRTTRYACCACIEEKQIAVTAKFRT